MDRHIQRRATHDDWQLTPMPERRLRLRWERTFTDDEYARLRLGHIPREMEDRWFIYMEPCGDHDDLYFHRSWTGYCIYSVRLERIGPRYTVAATYVNRESTQYRSMSEASDLAILEEMLIDGLLLAKPARLGPDDLLRHLRSIHGAGQEGE